MPPQCSSCRAAIPEGAKFCSECGAGVGRGCPRCGHAASGGRFCTECGSPLTPGATSATASHAVSAVGDPVSERRTTSVLFGDLVDFTALSESRDAEEVRELLSEYFAVARLVVGRYGGTIEKFIGDAVMAVWGVPVSREDDAERAVRAGLDLVTEVGAMAEGVGVPGLRMRVGITTGSVAVTLGAFNEGMVAGDAVNTAARVQSAAEPGTVWVDQETRGLTAAAVTFTDQGSHVLKGKADAVRLFRADAVVAAVGGAQRVDGLEAPMTGRDHELRTLKELFHATQEDARARIVVVTGVAGVGKSRLGWEYEKYVDGITGGVTWHRGRSLSYGEGIAFWAFAEMVRSRLGLLDGDDRETVNRKVTEEIARRARDEQEADWLAPRIAALLNPVDGVIFDRTDLFAAWTVFIERIGSDGDPVVMLFEDAQHADTGLLDLVEHLLATCTIGLFVVMLARPELLDQRPSLVAGRQAAVIGLDPLPEQEMHTLADGLVADLPAKVRSAIVSRAEGVPLYAVETVRTLIDREAVQERDGRFVFVDHDNTVVDLHHQLSAPVSLQMLIAARLDALGVMERRVAQNASVLGMSFRQEGLMALADVSNYELDQVLRALVRKGVLTTDEDPRSPERGQYRFLQALVREVAYGSLARKDRRALHLAAADHLETIDAGVADALAGVVAQHLLDALGASAQDDPERSRISERARGRLAAAAERAEELGSFADALDSLRGVMRLEPAPLELAGIHRRAARVAILAGDPLTGEECAVAALQEYERLGSAPEVGAVMALRARALMNLGRVEEAGEVVTTAIDRGVDGAVETRGELLQVTSAVARARGDLAEQTRSAFELMRIAENDPDTTVMITSLNAVAIVLFEAGGSTAYVALLERCLALARADRLWPEVSRTLSNLASGVYAEDLRRSQEIVDESVATAKRVGNAFDTEHALINASLTWWLSGDWDRLEAECAEWLDDGRPATSTSGPIWLCRAMVADARGVPSGRADVLHSEDPYDRSATMHLEALVAASDGRDEDAAALAAQASAGAYGTGDMFEDMEVSWAVAVELQLRAGRLGEARRLLSLVEPLLSVRHRQLTKAEHLRLTGTIKAAEGRDPEHDLRSAEQAFERYGAPYRLAQTRSELGRWLLAEGRVAEADAVLDQAREAFVRLGASPALDALDRLRSSITAAGLSGPTR